MHVRDALAEDAEAACDVMRASIIELCGADHRGEAELLDRWLANKTPDAFRAWLQPGNSVLVAVEGEAILAVGAVTQTGRITLNYVAPHARFQGASKAMLRALETRVAAYGAASCTLHSTETARRFYLGCGYVEAGPPEIVFGTQTGHPMSKTLGGAAR